MQSNQGYWCCKDLAITIYLCDASSCADHVHASWHLHAFKFTNLHGMQSGISKALRSL